MIASRNLCPNSRSTARWSRSLLCAALVVANLGVGTLKQAGAAPASSDPLAAGFRDPPNSARPRVWWHWMNGNITKEGIRKDMEWMKRIGIGGLQNFDAAIGTPQIVEQRLAYMTPGWKDAFRYTADLAEQLGLELAIAGSPGWSETGGPWVEPKDAMKKLVWSETAVPGGKRFSGRLPAPPSVTGPFQAMSLKSSAQLYADIAVLAYPAQAVAVAMPRIVSSAGETVDAALLSDDNHETAVTVDLGGAEEPGSLVFAYDDAQTIQSATVFIRGAAAMFSQPVLLPRLEVKQGAQWRAIAELPLTMVPTTVSFAPVTEREFRVVFAANPVDSSSGTGSVAPGAATGSTTATARPRTARVVELSLSAQPKVNQFEAKAGYAMALDYYALDGHTGPDIAGVAPNKVIDLTARMKPDGTFDWTPPKGLWKVLRLGYSLTGKTNHPATAEATGLEVDKYDGEAVARYLQTYIGMYRDAVGSELLGERGLRALLLDSTEVGASNWTPKLIERFQRARGYDPRPWLPALTGVIVGTRSKSDAFLYDFRRTLAEMMASEHYGQVARVAHEHGLKLYGEALEAGRATLGDDMSMRASADVPMAALWTYPRGEEPPPVRFGDMKGASSVAHLYGQSAVAAESLTSAGWPWAHAPADLRRIVDLEFACGVTRPVIHTSVHQPVDDKQPGLSLAIFGQFFTRHETWAEMAKPWIDYIARNSYLLQQGRDFADVAYFYGEEAPLAALFANAPLPDLPVRYAFDFVNADVLLNGLSVEDGALTVKSGARYRILYLGGSSHRMTLASLRRLHELAEAGATIVGMAPIDSPSLADDPLEFKQLVRKLWAGGTSTSVGTGRVIASKDVESALASIGIAPDFSYLKAQADSEVLFVHRRLADGGDVYYVNNRRNRPERTDMRFRVAGKAPQIWRADTGAVERVSYRIEGETTIVPLDMLPEESLFVVFREPASSASATVETPVLTLASQLDGTWDVSFQPGRGAPASVRLESLASLSQHPDPGIKYFSGVATYTKSFTLPKGMKPGKPLVLDLGSVADVAEVWVNGKPVGTVWKAPWRLDVGPATRAGRNKLEIRVANLWVNRLIGDVQPDAQKIAFTAMRTYKPDAPLRPSGLLGPVQLMRVAP